MNIFCFFQPCRNLSGISVWEAVSRTAPYSPKAPLLSSRPQHKATKSAKETICPPLLWVPTD
jgi:hypothetical protein